MFPSLRLAVPLLLVTFTGLLSALVLVFLVPQAEDAASGSVHELLRERLTRIQGGLLHDLMIGDIAGARREIAALSVDQRQQLALAIDDRGRVFAASRQAWVGQHLEEIDSGLEPGFVERINTHHESSVSATGDGQSVIGFASLPLAPERGELRSSRQGLLILKMDLSRAREAARASVLQQTVAWMGLLAALSFALWLVFHFVLTRRVERLVDVAEDVARGQLDARSGLTGSDELARVGRAFDAMAERLDRNFTEQQRTERERIKLEDRLRQAQRIEAVGRLAGGIAHDFNNLLTVIIGNADMMLSRLSPSEEFFEEANGILQVSERAATLTRQLLTFSRKQPSRPEILDLSEVVRETDAMLRRLIGEDILLETKLEETGAVEADRGQLEQVLVNLVLNAREAMPDGGQIRIETGDRDEWVFLVVRDVGCGMAPSVSEHVFEPFFTTKEDGTGLGLATTYGIVTGSQGRIEIESEPGVGTSVEICLPRKTSPAANTRRDEILAIPGRETVLLVEDDTRVRALIEKLLDKNGYRVLAAVDPEAALVVLSDSSTHIDILLTDVIMPRMNGTELAHRACQIRPELKVLFMSGYSADLIAERFGSDRTTNVLPKPFTSAKLTSMLREVLDAPRESDRS